MPHLYFVRHGQTIWNVENKICGSTDIALTPLGHEQAIAAGKLILERQYPIDAILYSPLMRAADTAKHIAEVTGLPAFAEPRLREQNFGKYGIHCTGWSSLSAGKNAVCEPLRGWRIHVAAGTADL